MQTYLPHFNLSAREHIALRRQLRLRLLPIGLTFPSEIKNILVVRIVNKS